MLRKTLYIFLPALMSLCLCSCSEEDLPGYKMSGEGTRPVEFEFNLPADLTRSLEGSKSSFVDGDVIHITGHFTNDKGGETDGYGCMRMENGRFTPVEGNTLVWPDEATAGSFTAYYINNSTGILQDGTQTQTTELAKVSLQTDPLKADSPMGIKWGHTVELEFTHALTYLQLVNLDPGVTDSFRLYSDFGGTGLNNAFFLVREGEQLSLKFIAIPSETSGEVYIAAPARNVNNAGEVTANCSFFLQPGDYSSFYLKTQNDEDYLSYSGTATKDLLANVPYIFDVKKSQGVIIVDENEESWDDSDEFLDIDVDEFLKAVVNGQDYYNKEDTQILAATQNGTKLLHNVNFNFFNHYETFDFEPTIPSGIVFDGGNHYIKNIGYPMFRYNYGTIQNLGIQTLRAQVVSEEHNEEIEIGIKDSSRQGGICCFNQSGATIQNVRAKDISITVSVKSDDSQESHNAGCLVGSNAGSMIDIAVYGVFSLTVGNYSENGESDVSAAVHAGGLVGQNVGILSSVTDLGGDNNLRSLTVTNKCTGRIGAFYIGGASGINSSVIDQVVLPGVTVDSRESMGGICYVGGLAGRLDSEANSNTAVLQSSTVSGNVYAGNCQKITDNAASYAGCIAGGVYNVSVKDCRSICNVAGITTNINSGVIYMAGGAFGRIFSTQQSIENITAWGTTLTGISPYLGNFAGALPLGQTFVKDYEPFNMLIREICPSMVGGNM